jgi:hypothetical protein
MLHSGWQFGRVCVVAVSLLCVLVICAPASAEHNHQFDDFNSGSVPPWWSSSSLTADPNGGSFLGQFTNDHAQMLIMAHRNKSATLI